MVYSRKTEKVWKKFQYQLLFDLTLNCYLLTKNKIDKFENAILTDIQNKGRKNYLTLKGKYHENMMSFQNPKMFV